MYKVVKSKSSPMKGKYHTEEIKKSLLSIFIDKHWKIVDKKRV